MEARKNLPETPLWGKKELEIWVGTMALAPSG